MENTYVAGPTQPTTSHVQIKLVGCSPLPSSLVGSSSLKNPHPFLPKNPLPVPSPKSAPLPTRRHRATLAHCCNTLTSRRPALVLASIPRPSPISPEPPSKLRATALARILCLHRPLTCLRAALACSRDPLAPHLPHSSLTFAPVPPSHPRRIVLLRAASPASPPPSPAFSDVLKHRYFDFIVDEVARDGPLVRLTSFDLLGECVDVKEVEKVVPSADADHLQTYPNPLQDNPAYSVVKQYFVNPDDTVCQKIVVHKDGPRGNHFRRAGPRQKVYFESDEVHACIVTCGGLCPGLNTVIREIVCGLSDMYRVTKILGIQVNKTS